MGISRNQLKQALDGGGDSIAVAARISVNVAQLRSLCHRFGLRCPPSGRRAIDGVLSRDLMQELLRTKTVATIAAEYGFAPQTVRDHMLRLGLQCDRQLTLAARMAGAQKGVAAAAAARAIKEAIQPADDLEPEAAPIIDLGADDVFAARIGAAGFTDARAAAAGQFGFARHHMQPSLMPGGSSLEITASCSFGRRR